MTLSYVGCVFLCGVDLFFPLSSLVPFSQAYLEFFASPEFVGALLEVLPKYESVNYHILNREVSFSLSSPFLSPLPSLPQSLPVSPHLSPRLFPPLSPCLSPHLSLSPPLL